MDIKEMAIEKFNYKRFTGTYGGREQDVFRGKLCEFIRITNDIAIIDHIESITYDRKGISDYGLEIKYIITLALRMADKVVFAEIKSNWGMWFGEDMTRMKYGEVPLPIIRTDRITITEKTDDGRPKKIRIEYSDHEYRQYGGPGRMLRWDDNMNIVTDQSKQVKNNCIDISVDIRWIEAEQKRRLKFISDVVEGKTTLSNAFPNYASIINADTRPQRYCIDSGEEYLYLVTPIEEFVPRKFLGVKMPWWPIRKISLSKKPVFSSGLSSIICS